MKQGIKISPQVCEDPQPGQRWPQLCTLLDRGPSPGVELPLTQNRPAKAVPPTPAPRRCSSWLEVPFWGFSLLPSASQLSDNCEGREKLVQFPPPLTVPHCLLVLQIFHPAAQQQGLYANPIPGRGEVGVGRTARYPHGTAADQTAWSRTAHPPIPAIPSIYTSALLTSGWDGDGLCIILSPGARTGGAGWPLERSREGGGGELAVGCW